MKKLTLKKENNFVWERINPIPKKLSRVMRLTIMVLQISVLSLVANNLYAQKTITGTVTDESGNTLPGVSIVETGTTKGTITDMDGKYSISVPDNAVLLYSFVGMINQEIAVAGRSTIDVVMKTDMLSLEGVVVVGYGVQRKETLTGSIAKISGEELTKSPNANVTANLQGKLPGLIANQRTGTPGGEDLDIVIRGKGTYGDSSPLIIIDGVERGMLERLNAQDIESITVLKDASAAIYGARAANGVILVTTKTGTIGKPVTTLNLTYSASQPTFKKWDMIDSWEFAEVQNERDYYTQGRPAPGLYKPRFTDAEIALFKSGADPVSYPNTDWPTELMRNWAPTQRANLQVNGGTESVKYLISVAASHQESVFLYTEKYFDQLNLRSKIDVKITDNLTAGINVNAMPNTNSGDDGNFWNIVRGDPTWVCFFPNGLPGPGRLGSNPAMGRQGNKNWTKTMPLYFTSTLTYKVPFVEGLQVDASFNYDIRTNNSHSWNVPRYYYEYIGGQYVKGTTHNGKASIDQTYRKWTTQMFNYRVSYDKIIGDHHIKAMVGQEQQQNYYSFIQASRKNFVSMAIDQINVGSNAAADKDNSGSATASAYNNYFGRLNYDYKSKYLAEFLFRRDGSQNFPKETRYGVFPGFSLGWRLSEEDFFKNVTSAFDQLKFRLSYGKIGNDRVPQYQYLQAFQFGNNYTFGSAFQPGVYSSALPNPNITWEVSEKTDIGVDATLWNHLLGVELTLWKENRNNILGKRNLSVPAIAGFPALPDQNIGEVNNNGFEFTVSHRNNINKLTYNISGNIAFARSKIVYMDETPNREPYQNLTGMPVGSNLYYKSDGIFHTQAELDAYPHQARQQVGDIKVIDLNNDGIIDSFDQYREDLTTTPEIVFGLSMGAEYKPFDINLFFQGQTRVNMFDEVMWSLGSVTGSQDNGYRYRYTDHWTVNNTDGTMPRANDAQGFANLDFWLYDATFIRLKSMEIGYTLPSGLTSRIGLGSARVSFSGNNLLTWAKEVKWVDPEMNAFTMEYPPQRDVNIGIKLTF